MLCLMMINYMVITYRDGVIFLLPRITRYALNNEAYLVCIL